MPIASYCDLPATDGLYADGRLVALNVDTDSIVGTFDVVFCGDVLLHLFSPFQALLNIRSVTREVAIIQTSLDEGVESLHPDFPLIRFGARQFEKVTGDQCTYWMFSTKALQEMMEYAGFPATEPREKFKIPGGPVSTSVVGRVAPP